MAVRATHKRCRRIRCKAPITLEDRRTGFYYPGILHNYSKSGLYFECAYAHRPGRKIRIKSNGLPFGRKTNGRLAEVTRRTLLDRSRSTRLFGVGAKFC
ncbi:MAG: hypothetical protein JRE88_00160 [Deltaproteobacteria bacterium]|jgi:hypothetical protein|nr:hypothetical protein [Deltaproteobacteria bacterium]